MGVEEGDRVAFVQRGGEVVLRPVRQTLRDLRGSVAVAGEQDFAAIRASVQHTRAQHHTGTNAESDEGDAS
jgi:hypothetical protein